MNGIFGIGGWEMILVMVIAIIVAGPKRIAQWAYVLGQWTSKLQTMWAEVAVSLQKELDESGVDIKVPKSPPTRADLQRSLQDYGKQVMDAAGNPEKELKNIQRDLQSVSRGVKSELDGLNRDVQNATKPPSPNGIKQTAPEPPAANEDSSPNNTAKPDDDAPSLGTWGGGDNE